MMIHFKTFAVVFAAFTVTLAATEPTAKSDHDDAKVAFVPLTDTQFKPFGNVSAAELPLERRACAPGYGLCPGGCCKLDGWCCGNGCCNKGYGCCENKGCFPIGAQCCSNGGYCTAGNYCVKRSNGSIGCCPNGKICFG
ncbi:hypothetical protein BKA62DRAFT_714041 [Auriculariales sp. MPI-PUGE-AT-0066]|nr:hypothetical protein BKA62DRAFT_714041 [Auriculariales sp. MPI-PUGE-AT-0066]